MVLVVGLCKLYLFVVYSLVNQSRLWFFKFRLFNHYGKWCRRLLNVEGHTFMKFYSLYTQFLFSASNIYLKSPFTLIYVLQSARRSKILCKILVLKMSFKFGNHFVIFPTTICFLNITNKTNITNNALTFFFLPLSQS